MQELLDIAIDPLDDSKFMIAAYFNGLLYVSYTRYANYSSILARFNLTDSPGGIPN